MTTNIHQQILSEFLNSNIKIKSLDRLNEYISYCISNNQNEPTKFKTSHHHILPKSKSCFPKFKNLKENTWNGTYLLHSDHYYAHWLLTEAIDNYGQLYAFLKMHSCDVKNGRINENELINEDIFQEMMAKRKEKQSKLYSSPEWIENVGRPSMLRRLKKIDWTKQSKLISKGLLTIEENGKTKAQNAAARATAKKLKTIDENGKNVCEIAAAKRVYNMTNVYDENGKNAIDRSTEKMVKTRKLIGDDGLSSFQRSEKNKAGNIVYQHIKIYDSDNNIVYDCNGDFNQICEDNNLPRGALYNSIIKNKPIFQNRLNGVIRKYKGWYAKLII